jgi:putative ABC transport system ATP-binding protein
MNNTAEPRTVILTSLLSKTYLVFESKVEVLKNINLEVKEGEFITISGPSGSGKTTLLNIIGAIDKQTSGKIYVFDEDLETKNEDFLAEFRCTRVGFVFQSYNLVSTLTVLENVAFPMEWRREPDLDIRERVEELLELVGLRQRSEHFPFQLSGGEQQRVAFARALANNPPMLLVDEPTGNLDRKTSAHVVEILKAMKAQNKTLIVATHDSRISELADQTLWLENGKLMNQNE